MEERVVLAGEDNPASFSRRPIQSATVVTGNHVACSLSATDGVDDVGRIDAKGSGHEVLDMLTHLDALALSQAFDVSITVFMVRENDKPNAFFRHFSPIPTTRSAYSNLFWA
jgi:hypothetical protein